MFANLVYQIKQAIHTGVQALRKYISASTKSANTALVRGSLVGVWMGITPGGPTAGSRNTPRATSLIARRASASPRSSARR